MNKSTLTALVVALMLGSGIAGYLIGTPGEQLDRPSPPPSSGNAGGNGPRDSECGEFGECGRGRGR